MSHFIEIKTQIKDIEALRLARQELGLTLLQNTEARGYYEKKTKGDHVVQLKGPYDIALNKQPDGILASLLISGRVTSKKKLARVTANSYNFTASTKPRSKPGRKVYLFFAAINKTGPSNSCLWGCHEQQNHRNHQWDHWRNPN